MFSFGYDDAKAADPPKGECRQCWDHAYRRGAHEHLAWNEDCRACLSHMGGNHGNMIVK